MDSGKIGFFVFIAVFCIASVACGFEVENAYSGRASGTASVKLSVRTDEPGTKDLNVVSQPDIMFSFNEPLLIFSDLTVCPEPEISYYEYRAVPRFPENAQGFAEDWKYISMGEDHVAVLNEMAPGYWDIEIRARSSAGVVLYEGKTSMFVVSGENNARIVLAPVLNGTGKGSIEIEVETPGVRGGENFSLTVLYRKAGKSAAVREAQIKEIKGNGYIVWTLRLDNLDAGRYELVFNMVCDGQTVCGRAVLADVNAGSLVGIEGGLDGGYEPETTDIAVSLLDLIEIAEREGCTATIVGFRDTYTGKDFTDSILSQGSFYTLRDCRISGFSSSVTFRDIGVEPIFRGTEEETAKAKLCVITHANNDTPAGKSWVGAGENATGGPVPEVRTIYVNKNIAGEAFMSVDKCTRLILGTHPDFTVIEEAGLEGFSAVPYISIPSNIRTIEDYGIRIKNKSESLKIYIGSPEGTFSSSAFTMSSSEFSSKAVWNSALPLSQL